ncbi:DMT family transporter [Sediminicurvatus halobius]|uniref:EamA family transporter n=1 Tax=Sediminicurvatus halobius TaxID=2182432 RepID=A0A2U2N0I6_9GAMM|nr:DMT family transporter [Spiribacter halobius]PWG62489.1 EamA family transporter [Spiribacter halobius]UEX78581.1 DMT family transporter [Spiribacter halobius]
MSTATGSALVSPARARLLLLAVVLLWGANWPVMKVGLESIGPLTFAATRMLLGGATLAVVAALQGQLRLPDRADWPVVFGVGLLQMAGFLGLVNLGLQYVPAGRSAILAYTTAIWVVPLAAMLLGERLAGRRLAGFVIGIAGVGVLFNPFGFDWTDRAVLLGNGLLLLAALLWAILIVQVRGHAMRGSPLSLGPWQFAVAALVLTPLALLLEGTASIRWSPQLAVILAYNGPLATGFCFWAMITVTRALPAITTSLSSLAVPVTGMLLAAVTIGEPLTVTNLAGLALILGGVGLVSVPQSR